MLLEQLGGVMFTESMAKGFAVEVVDVKTDVKSSLRLLRLS